VDVYLDHAGSKGLRIDRVLETHIHADFASGARELAERAGAELCVSGHDEGERYQAAFAHRDLHDGDVLELGSVRIRCIHTPGHTPEHLSYRVGCAAGPDDGPDRLLSGDFLFVGSLGRPDLLGEEAKRELAGAMYDSVRTVLADLPDDLEVHPGHGAGSMCGSGMSGRASSTLGFERLSNPFLEEGLGREEFVGRLLGNVPPFPPYYRRRKEVNASGPKILGGLPGLRGIAAPEVREMAETGGVVIDLRGSEAFGAGHVPGAFGIGAGGDLSVWASWVVPYERPIFLVADGVGTVEEAVRSLIRVGLDDVRGYLDGGMAAWLRAGLPTATTDQLSVEELHRRLRDETDLAVLDVRTDEEWAAGHIAGARHIMGGELPERIGEVDVDGRPLAVICDSGYRSTVAASVLERAGLEGILNVAGGMSAWRSRGLPTVTD
jgi:hydroxyacylglutathione hydrolase